MADKKSKGRIPGKKDGKSNAASGSMKPRKAEPRFIPRKYSGRPAGGESVSTTIPRRKAVLSGSNAGQDS